jgi:hypothetical protein
VRRSRNVLCGRARSGRDVDPDVAAAVGVEFSHPSDVGGGDVGIDGGGALGAASAAVCHEFESERQLFEAVIENAEIIWNLKLRFHGRANPSCSSGKQLAANKKFALSSPRRPARWIYTTVETRLKLKFCLCLGARPLYNPPIYR